MSAFEVSSDLSKYLAPGERILWQGRSRSRLASMGGGSGTFGVVALALGIVFLIGLITVVVIMASASRTERSVSPAVPAVVLLVLVMVVLSVSVALVMRAARGGSGSSSGAHYVVTSAAAMIVSESLWFGKRVTVAPWKSAPLVSLIENRDGTGSLLFGPAATTIGGRYPGAWLMDATPGFWNIEQPMEVYQLIRRQMAGE